ncbi:MAG: hypothetical protein IPM69_19975 [Ignavibacteria bacterium]|nr:hypothetical protein [Ignavibacteria bacterium]
MAEIPVLIIDDDIWMQRILSKRYYFSFGFIPYVASSLLDGITLAVEHKPALHNARCIDA